jgi:hypothetical protein
MFGKKNILRYILFFLVFSSLFGLVIYNLLTTRHQAIIKTFALQNLGILNKNWLVYNHANYFIMESPSFFIDGIYKSMEGPKSSRYIQLNTKKELLWVTGFDIKALEEKNDKLLSNDFICHTNIDINDAIYYQNFNLQDRIGKQYPRLTSLSHGLESFKFPNGYGIPVYGDDYLYITTQALNHNKKEINLKVKHQINISYNQNTKNVKPLKSITAFIQLPFKDEDIHKEPNMAGADQCIPVETKNHTYLDTNTGNKLSGHWKIPKGKTVYRSNINTHLLLQQPEKLHFAAPHVHPFATAISIYDKTTKTNLFTCNVKNYKQKIGLQKIETFSSEIGIWLYPNHQYEMVIEVNNTSKQTQDMMGSMFLFFYDKELHDKLKNNAVGKNQ